MRVPTLILLSILAGAATGSGTAAYLTELVLRQVSTPVLVPPLLARRAHVGPTVAPELQTVADAFSSQLAAKGEASLDGLVDEQGVLLAWWTAPRCDWTESEILDLVRIVHEEYRGPVKRLVASRYCEGTSRQYFVPGAVFERYQSGISDPSVLRYLIDSATSG